MQQHIRFCTTSDGVRIAYAVAGEGPAIVWCYSWVTHLQAEWDNVASRAFLEGLARGRTLVRFDKRGVGLSDRNVTDLSREARLRDLEAVVEAAGLDRFVLAGQSESGPTTLMYAARYPERVSALILYGTYHRFPLKRETMDPIIALVRQQWGMGSAAMTAAFARTGDPTQVAFLNDLQRIGASSATAAALFESNLDLDVTPVLEHVQAPTLVLHRRKDPVIPLDTAREMAALIPGARIQVLEGDIHPPYWGDTRSILDAIDDFLGTPRDERAAAAGASGVRTVLFTDLVGHTEMMQRLGDARGREVLREHERITRAVLGEHGGREVKTMGDGFMASFASVASAVDCAVALQRAFALPRAVISRDGDEPLQVRVGLNAGEPIEEEGDLFGATVILASRIAAHAGAGEILVPEHVRHLLAGKRHTFVDRGAFTPKGFADSIRVYSVEWRENVAP